MQNCHWKKMQYATKGESFPRSPVRWHHMFYNFQAIRQSQKHTLLRFIFFLFLLACLLFFVSCLFYSVKLLVTHREQAALAPSYKVLAPDHDATLLPVRKSHREPPATMLKAFVAVMLYFSCVGFRTRPQCTKNS